MTAYTGSGTIAATSSLSAGTVLTPLFDIRDIDNLQIDEIHFESIYAGLKAATQIIKLINNSDSSLNLIITPHAASAPVGSAIDTYLSTYLYEASGTPVNSLDVTIPSFDNINVYIDYQPPSTAKVGEKKWQLNVEGVSFLDGFDYSNPIIVTGSVDGNLTNYLLPITINYDSDFMKSDFGDIRFIDNTFNELNYYMFNKTDGVSADFFVKVPSIPQNPATTIIYVCSGNSEATTTSTLRGFDCYFDWLNGNLGPWIETVGLNTIESVTLGHNALKMQTDTNANYYARVYKPNSNVIGEFKCNFKFEELDPISFRFYPIMNGDTIMGDGYFIYAQTNGLFYLVRRLSGNDTILIDSTFTPDTNLHEIKFRNDGHNLTIYLDGIEKGTIVNADVSTSTRIWLESNTTNAHVIVDNVQVPKTIGEELTPPLIEERGWTNVRALVVKGGILYQSQDLPKLDPEIRHGCRIGGVLYE